MKNSHIEWTDHTFNPWIGCTKVSAGCANCYAETRDQRFAGGIHWGKGAPRQRTAVANWRDPLQWNKTQICAECGAAVLRGKQHECENRPGNFTFADEVDWRRPRVFCASLADWLDDEVPIEWLADLLALIHQTPNLDWLLLTKRPENWRGRVTRATIHLTGEAEQWASNWVLFDDSVPANVWVGTSVENEEMADRRIPQLLKIPARVRFLSCEPLLGAVDLQNVEFGLKTRQSVLTATYMGRFDARIDWVICGGESGPNARGMSPYWARDLRDQCQGASTPFFFKQWGEWMPTGQQTLAGPVMAKVGKKLAGRLLDGREWNEFPKSTSVVNQK